jgi:hypothetical protein
MSDFLFLSAQFPKKKVEVESQPASEIKKKKMPAGPKIPKIDPKIPASE